MHSSQAPASISAVLPMCLPRCVGTLLGLTLLVVAPRAMLVPDLVPHKHHPVEKKNLWPSKSPGLYSGGARLCQMFIMAVAGRMGFTGFLKLFKALTPMRSIPPDGS